MPLACGWVVCSRGPLHSHSVMLDSERRWDHAGSKRAREQGTRHWHRIWSLKGPDFQFHQSLQSSHSLSTLWKKMLVSFLIAQSIADYKVILNYCLSSGLDILATGPRAKFTKKNVVSYTPWTFMFSDSASVSLLSVPLDWQDAEARLCVWSWC